MHACCRCGCCRGNNLPGSRGGAERDLLAAMAAKDGVDLDMFHALERGSSPSPWEAGLFTVTSRSSSPREAASSPPPIADTAADERASTSTGAAMQQLGQQQYQQQLASTQGSEYAMLPSIETAAVGADGKIVYKIVLGSNQNQVIWRRYSEFAALRKLLMKLYPNTKKLPFPRKTIGLKSPRKSRRGGRESSLEPESKVVVARQDGLARWIAAIATICAQDAVLRGFLAPELQHTVRYGEIDEVQLLQLAKAYRSQSQ